MKLLTYTDLFQKVKVSIFCRPVISITHCVNGENTDQFKILTNIMNELKPAWKHNVINSEIPKYRIQSFIMMEQLLKYRIHRPQLVNTVLTAQFDLKFWTKSSQITAKSLHKWHIPCKKLGKYCYFDMQWVK